MPEPDSAPDSDAGLDLDPDFAAHPNDAYFKAVFSRLEHAAVFFRGHLPPEIRQVVDRSSLVLLSGSFVEGSLQNAHPDLVFSVRIADGEASAILYLLFGHRMTVDPAMPLGSAASRDQEPDRGLGLPGFGRAEPRAFRHGLTR